MYVYHIHHAGVLEGEQADEARTIRIIKNSPLFYFFYLFFISLSFRAIVSACEHHLLSLFLTN
jgi:hypothetical protein